jgi:ABC-type Zn uptake system ZnuABC Zn-binding protein ZnuA
MHRPGWLRATRLAVGLSLVAVVSLQLPACAPPGGSGGSAGVNVVTTTTIFADFVRQVGGDRVAVRSLVPAGGEVHTFDPRPSDVLAFADADLVLMNGLGLDDWVIQLVGDAGSDAPIIRLAEDLPEVTYLAGEEADAGAGEAVNPHLWLRVDYAALYVDRVVDELSAIDPDGADEYQSRGDAYRAKLDQLDQWVGDQLSGVPAADRRIVSLHDAFPYFAEAYGLEVVGTVIDVPGQDPSAGEVADLVDAIRASGVSAILSEAQFPGDLPERIAGETGVQVISDLYSDSVGPAPQDSYEAIIRWDVERIATALRE